MDLLRGWRRRFSRQQSDDELMKATTSREENAIMTAAATARKTSSPAERLPLEMVEQIIRRLPPKSALAARATCRRWRAVVEQPRLERRFFATKQISRLTISSVPQSAPSALLSRRSISVRWCEYGASARARDVQISIAKLGDRSCRPLAFAFRHFRVQRLFLQDLAPGVFCLKFVDSLLDWIRTASSDVFALTLDRVAMSASDSAAALRRLIEALSPSLETFEFRGCSTATLTDEHLALLSSDVIRRIEIEATNGGASLLSVSDASLRRFIDARRFPTLMIDRCQITTAGVCDYVDAWLSSRSERQDQNQNMMSHLITVKRCPGVRARAFESECRHRQLAVVHRRQQHQQGPPPPPPQQQRECPESRQQTPIQISYTIKGASRLWEFAVVLTSQEAAPQKCQESSAIPRPDPVDA